MDAGLEGAGGSGSKVKELLQSFEGRTLPAARPFVGAAGCIASNESAAEVNTLFKVRVPEQKLRQRPFATAKPTTKICASQRLGCIIAKKTRK